ncbi:MAG: hypothetical protein ACI9EX_000466 [Oleispira sp.]|jgi:hypothetical protein
MTQCVSIHDLANQTNSIPKAVIVTLAARGLQDDNLGHLHRFDVTRLINNK